MERDQFVNGTADTLWLFSDELPNELVETRRQLGAAFEWSDNDWYKDEQKRQRLYEFIEKTDQQLWRVLEEAADQPTKEREWAEMVVSAATPEAEEKEKEAPDEVAPTKVPLESKAVDPVEVAEKNSIFGKKAALASDGESAPAEADVEGKAATEPAPAKSLFGKKKAAQTEQESSESENISGDFVEQIKASMADIEPSVLAEIAGDLEMDPDEISSLASDPEFAKMVEAELAAIQDGD